MDDIIKALKKCAIFKGLDNAKIEVILSRNKYHIKQYSRNELICKEAQFSENVGIIIVGSIEVQKVLASGNLICMFHSNQGDMFGGAVVFSSVTTYPCDVFSRDNSIILFFSKQSIYEMCQEYLIAKNLLNCFANKILEYENRIELFSYSSIQKKIAFFLLDEFKKFNSCTIHLSFTKKSWAEYLNVSRPSLCRELKKLCDNNIITINMNEICILNEVALTNILQQ